MTTPNTTPEIETPEVPEIQAPEINPIDGQGSTETPAAEPPPTNDQAPQGEPTLDAQIALYQGALQKFEEDNTYQMTDEEVEAFSAVQDRVMNGDMEDPGLPKKGDVKPENKSEKEKAPTHDKDTGEPIPGIQGIPKQQSDSILKAMEKVGAKDMAELPEKIEGLINHMKTSGGKVGSELAQYKEREANHRQWLKDLSEGKPAAIEHLARMTNQKFSLAGSKGPQEGKPLDNSDNPEDLNIDDFLDDKLAPIVLELKKQLKDTQDRLAAREAKDSQKDQELQTNSAISGWVSDVVNLVTDYANDFSLTPREAKALAEEYWGPDGHKKPVRPEFNHIHEIIKFCNDKNLPDLETAHIVWQQKNGTYAQKLIAAQKQGEAAVQRPITPNSAMSNQQGRQRNNLPDPNIDESAVAAMEKGNLDIIPDDWSDEQGNLIPSKVPKRFHKQAFGKVIES